MYKAGFCEADITPPLGSIIPGDFRARYSVGILDRIYTRAAVICDGESKLAIATIDACGIYRDVTERVRERVASHTDIKPEAIMVTATHTHSGGPTLNWGEEVRIDPAYIDHIVTATADAIIKADADAQAGEDVSLVNAAKEVDDVGFIRIYKMKDGSYRTNAPSSTPEQVALIEDHYTTPDNELRVIAAMSHSRPVGAIVNFACHPAGVAGVKTCGDFVGALSRAMKRMYGPEFVTVFVNGACGNINHINAFDPATKAKGRHIYMGERLAAGVQELLSGAPAQLTGKVNCITAPVSLGVRRPTKEALDEAYDTLIALGDDYEKSVPGSAGYQKTFYAMQAMMRMLDKRNSIETSVQILDICGVKLVGYPVQLFTEFGKATKAGIPGAMVSIFANDYLGYGPVPEMIRPGVYEARLCATSMLAPDTGDRLVNTACEAVKSL